MRSEQKVRTVDWMVAVMSGETISAQISGCSVRLESSETTNANPFHPFDGAFSSLVAAMS